LPKFLSEDDAPIISCRKATLGEEAAKTNNYSDAMAYYKQVFEQTSNPVLKTVPLNNMAAVEEKQYQKQ
jgi:hypothetical protein